MSNKISHVYILGSETETIRLCLKQISPKLLEETDGRNIWTVLGNARITYGLGGNCPTELSSLDIESQAWAKDDVFALTEKGKPLMQRLKSSDEQSDKCLRDCSLKSESVNTTIAVDENPSFTSLLVHAIVLKTELATELPLFILHRFCGPGLYILAIDPETFEANKNLYEKIIKELSTYSLVTKSDQHSMLFIVDVSRQSGGEKSKEATRLYCSFRTTYFGNHFKIVNLHELLDKISPENIPRVDIKRSVDSRMFSEIQESDFKEAEESNNRSSLCFKVDEQYFECHELDKLLRIFLGIISKLKEKNILSHTIHPVNTFIHEIEEIEDTNKILAALQAAGLVFDDEKNDRLYILPLVFQGIVSENIVYADRSLVLDSSIYRLTMNLKATPLVLKSQIVKQCLRGGWMLESPQTTNSDISQESIILLKGLKILHLMFVSIPTGSLLYFSIHKRHLSVETSNIGDAIPNPEEIIRQEIENIILKTCGINVQICKRELTDKKDFSPVSADQKTYSDVEDLIRTGPSLNQYEQLLKPWFTKEYAMLAEKLNEKMSDDKLTKIAPLFGKGYDLFFVDQGIPYAEIERTQKENPGDIVTTVFILLRSWRKKKGSNANFETLRCAFTNYGIQIDLRTYDNIVKENT